MNDVRNSRDMVYEPVRGSKSFLAYQQQLMSMYNGKVTTAPMTILPKLAKTIF